MKNIKIKGALYHRLDTPVATVEPYRCRILIVYDRQPSNAAGYPAISSIIQRRDVTGTAPGSVVTWDPPNRDNSDRFIIIRDCQFSFPTNNTSRYTTTQAVMQEVSSTFADDQGQCNLFIKLRGLETHYNNSANPVLISMVTSGSLLMYVLGDTANASAIFGYSFQFRLNFWDT